MAASRQGEKCVSGTRTNLPPAKSHFDSILPGTGLPYLRGVCGAKTLLGQENEKDFERIFVFVVTGQDLFSAMPQSTVGAEHKSGAGATMQLRAVTA